MSNYKAEFNNLNQYDFPDRFVAYVSCLYRTLELADKDGLSEHNLYKRMAVVAKNELGCDSFVTMFHVPLSTIMNNGTRNNGVADIRETNGVLYLTHAGRKTLRQSLDMCAQKPSI